jgi:hypothetical protein
MPLAVPGEQGSPGFLFRAVGSGYSSPGPVARDSLISRSHKAAGIRRRLGIRRRHQGGGSGSGRTLVGGMRVGRPRARAGPEGTYHGPGLGKRATACAPQPSGIGKDDRYVARMHHLGGRPGCPGRGTGMDRKGVTDTALK